MNTYTLEFPKYQCHKTVHALKIAEILPESDGKYAALTFTDKQYPALLIRLDWARSRSAAPGGYYVVYEDGYDSFSPASEFEKDYTLIEEK